MMIIIIIIFIVRFKKLSIIVLFLTDETDFWIDRVGEDRSITLAYYYS